MLAPLIVFALLAVGCGGMNTPAAINTPTPPTGNAQNAIVTGQYNLVLTSSAGHGTTNIYTDFTPTGTTFTAAANTLVCPSNEVSKCSGGDAPAVSIKPTVTVSGAKVAMVIAFGSTAGADTITLLGTAAGTTLAGTYSDTLGDAGTWTASTAVHPLPTPPGVYRYAGTFNSTSNPLLTPSNILIDLGRDAVSGSAFNLTATAAMMNSCISSLNLSGEAIGDAFTLADAASQAHILAVPDLRAENSYTFSYHFDPTAASCAGDSGRGVVTIQPSPFDY